MSVKHTNNGIPSGHEADAHGFKPAHKHALMLASAYASGSIDLEDWTDHQRYKYIGGEGSDGGLSGEPVEAEFLEEQDSNQCSGTNVVPVED